MGYVKLLTILTHVIAFKDGLEVTVIKVFSLVTVSIKNGLNKLQEKEMFVFHLPCFVVFTSP